jgi:TatD DNase family protein
MNSVLSRSLDRALPPLDVHAHIDPTVTAAQLATLGSALVFAVTRSLDEAAAVASRHDPQLLWGCGVHPGVNAAVSAYDPATFRSLIDRFVLVGEVGLDRRGSGEAARGVFADVVAATAERPMLLTIHSAGQSAQVLEVLGRHARGAILHWFTGTAHQIDLAASQGAYFSANVAMTDEQLNRLPRDRVLPETDFPFSRKGGSARPGDIERLEQRVSQLWRMTRDDVRQGWYRNLRELCIQAGTIDSLPSAFAVPVLAA